MAIASLTDSRVHYELAGPAEAPVLVFSNSLGTNFSMWDAQAAEVRKRLRVLRYDTRGHGQSSVTPGPYSIEQLGQDVLALADVLKVDEFSFCGLSMGGLIGMWLGVHAGERLRKLALCSTAAKIGNEQTWNARIEAVRKNGMKSIAPSVMERWYTAGFRQRHREIVEGTKQMIENTDVEGYAGCCGALREADLRESIRAIRTPTVVITGAHDPTTPPADGRFLAERIPGARYAELDAAHLCNVEDQAGFASELSKFLAK